MVQLCVMGKLVLVKLSQWMELLLISSIEVLFLDQLRKFSNKLVNIKIKTSLSKFVILKSTTSKCLIYLVINQETHQVGQEFQFKMMPRVKFMLKDCHSISLITKKMLWIICLKEKQERQSPVPQWMNIVVELIQSTLFTLRPKQEINNKRK